MRLGEGNRKMKRKVKARCLVAEEGLKTKVDGREKMGKMKKWENRGLLLCPGVWQLQPRERKRENLDLGFF